jgi:sterol 14alpha-demethylase
MGSLRDILGPLSQQLSQLSTASQVGIFAGSFILLAVLLNVLQQILFKNPNEPPVVFHWFPIIGSTITYGMDPPTFFQSMRAKVSEPTEQERVRAKGTTRMC